MYFQDIIKVLNQFWQEFGCVILQGYDLEKGAATLSPYSFFASLDTKPCSIAYLDPCRRPDDSRYAVSKTNRYQHYYQYQVLIKPEPTEPKKIFLNSLEALEINIKKVDLIFKDDSWESPVFGAMGQGWEVWLNGSEIAQLTYLHTVGGVTCKIVPLEITYGLERLALSIQQVDSFSSIAWNQNLTYGDIYKQSEIEASVYNLEVDDTQFLLQSLQIYIQQIETLTKKELVYPALDYLLKASHTFNILNVRNTLSELQKSIFLTNIRNLATVIAELYIRRNI